MPDNDEIREMCTAIEKIHQDLRSRAPRLQTPQGRALAETACEVMGGIKRAFDHYLTKSEEVWE